VGGEVEINTLLPPFLINAIICFFIVLCFVLTQNEKTKEKVKAALYSFAVQIFSLIKLLQIQ